MDERLTSWTDPFGQQHPDVPTDLARRLEQMASEIKRDAGDPQLAGRIYYERMHALLAAAGITRGLDTAAFDLASPPSRAEKTVGQMIGQAFHQGCSLDDVALATGLPSERVVAIGKRTIKRKKWLERL